MVSEIGRSAGAENLFNQTHHLDNPALATARQENILQRQQQVDQMLPLTEIETDSGERAASGLDAGEIIDFADDFRDVFMQLQQAAEPFIDESPLSQPVLEERTVEVSDSDIVTGEAEAGAELQEREIEITELAQEQLMRGEELPADDPEVVYEGDYEFIIEQQDREETIEIEVDEDETPQDILQTAAEEIEAASAGVEADVFIEEDEVFLEVRSEEPGEAGEFEIRDAPEGDFIEEQLGMTVEQQAEEADVEINGLEEGEDFALRGNAVQLQEGDVILELEETGTAEIEVAPDVEAAADVLENFVGAVDDLQQFIADQPASPTLQDMGAQLEETFAEREDDLAQIGIEIGPEGEVQIEEEVLQTALTEEVALVEQIFEDEGLERGLAVEADMTAERALTQPVTEFIEAAEVDNEREEREISPVEDFQIYNQSGQMNPMMTVSQGELLNIVM